MHKPLRPFMPPDPKGEFPFDVPVYLVNLFVAVSRLRDTETEKALRPLDLNLTRFRTLFVIWRMGDCVMSELATVSATDRTSLTRAVDQLVAAGLVQRSEAERDRRKVKLSLTDHGRAVVRQGVALVEAVNATLLQAIPEEDQRTMVRGLLQMLDNLGATDEITRALGSRIPDAE
ncbi:MAG TPA: MarR family winged helix-turn-helix transcriptional regulator [Caulobacteraceae bacterium]|nr:MarR family winged helix-turn-helix transcriptional regulator [Caulobacteraceae bacterium]